MSVIHKKDQPDKVTELQKELEGVKESQLQKEEELTMLKGKNEALEMQLTDTQLALVEIYESVVR